MENNMELNLDQMEKVIGGRGGFPTKPPEMKEYKRYQIQRGDTLGGIARDNGTTVEVLKSINSSIMNVNDITAGYWIYIPR